MRVIIDPRSSYGYGSFYLKELKRQYGVQNVCYKISPFRKLPDLDNDIRFIIEQNGKQTKYFIHANDSYHIMKEDYEWCNVYGNVNANFAHYPKEKYPKQISLVPSYGISELSMKQTMWLAFRCFLQTWPTIVRRKAWNKYKNCMEINPYYNIKHYFGSSYYKIWKNRLPLSRYTNNVVSEDDYIFFLSTLWYNNGENKNDETVNLRRAHFIRACKSIEGIEYEGGLLGDKSSSNEKFADVLATHGEPFDQWIEKTKRSALVFNTPAFWDCHGWKLGEYLALGKCIVSTKLSNDLPHPLEHGKNIHFVEDTEESMREAVEYILAHPEYRHKLEKGARAYWEKYGTPEASLKLLGIQ